MSLKMKLFRSFSLFVMVVIFVASLRGNALAVDMNAGDLVFVMFGNNTEFIQNLGPASTLLAPGTHTFPISPSTLSSVSGTNPVNWALIGYNQTSSIVLLAGSSLPPSAFTPTQLSQVSIANPTNVTAIWEAQSSGDGLSQKLLPASDMNSFTYNFGTSGTLAGGFPVAMQGLFGFTLSIISGDYNTNALSLLGEGQVFSDGSALIICNPQCPPRAVSLTPVNISTAPGTPQSFTAVYSDPDGYMNISTATLSLSGSAHNERLDYNLGTNKFTMVGVGGDCSPGQAATLSDGNLTLNCSSSSVSGSGTTLTLTFNLTPQPPLSGAAYLLIITAVDQSAASNSKTTGTWTVNRTPSAVSCTPTNSTTPVGTTQTFVCVYSDLDGYQNIAAANLYLSGNGGVHNEYPHYLVAPNLFTMLGSNDICSPGQAKTLTSGYLTLDCATSSISGSGTTLTVNFRVTPQAPSSGIQFNNFSTVSDQAGGANAIFAGTWGIP
jgi:hypothetical protein